MPNRDANGAMTLAGRYYTDRSVYDMETENIFLTRWLYVGRAAAICETGQYLVVDVETESVVVLRDGDGEVRALHNVCRHRGTRLCEGAAGRFSKSIQCPYHAWTYALDGSLIGAPHMRDVDGFDYADYPLHPVAVAEWGGGVFINLDPHPVPFGDAFAPLSDRFDQWRMDQLGVAHEIVYDVAANWKLVFQNYSECYHCPTLHPALNRLTPYRDSINDLEEGPVLGGPMRLAVGNESMTMTGRTCATPFAEPASPDRRSVYYYTVFPNLLLSLFPEYVLIHRIERLAPDRTRIVCSWLFDEDAIRQPDFDPSGAVEFWNMTNKQDWAVSELSQRGVSSRAYQPGPYSNLESMIAAWDREYLRSLGEIGDGRSQIVR